MPGDDVEDLKGGAAGGSIRMVRVGDEMDYCQQGRGRHDNLRPYCVAWCGQERPASAVHGGLIGVGKHMVPTLMRSDRLVGQVLCLKSTSTECEDSGGQQGLEDAEAVEGRSAAVKQDPAKILLTVPLCTQERKKIAIRRRIKEH
ncbi:hypothetical protein KXD40_009644 [Peronospora effusa]|uniref:Initiation factor eIF2 gamma C-terminal domain-containing protein n=1 Tax=Peronospora effusa TaxID=542832 RepID=A0A3M6VSW8_9STRA|nr:hypothetical protein DD238_001871 [Peronospora effusa]RQM17165.1 hypothetical protein DD237_002524 [Peronospora effusa]UIZ23821.1 hypothetical protein KXD40_009644 [Peronospora effusa]